METDAVAKKGRQIDRQHRYYINRESQRKERKRGRETGSVIVERKRA